LSFPEWKDIRDFLAPGNASEYGLKESDYPMIDDETPTFMRQPLATRPEDLKGADVVIIGAPYVAGDFVGIPKKVWAAAPKRVRQVSSLYFGYLQEFDLNLLKHLKILDFGDAECEVEELTADNVLKAQRAVETKVNQVLDAGAIPIVIGQNSPCGSYAIAKPIAERTKGNVGCISIDEHWDIGYNRSTTLDNDTMDSRIAGPGCWKSKMYEFHKNMHPMNLVEIGERGMFESQKLVRGFLERGAHFYPMWKVREIGIEQLCREIRYAYEGTDAVYVHYDMDVLGHESFGTMCEPIEMTNYEVFRLSLEIGKRGFNGLSFICIPPDMIGYKAVVYVIMYMLAGKILAGKGSNL